MAEFSYRAPELLQVKHVLTDFDCGKAPLNEFLQRYALPGQSSGSVRTFVVATSDLSVIGYYSLTAAAITHEEAPDRVRKGQPKHPIPAILMARFAVDRRAQGQGLGRSLFRDAMLRALNITNELGARAFIVDAKDAEAIRFYEKFQMMPAQDDPHRLFLLFKDIRKLLS